MIEENGVGDVDSARGQLTKVAETGRVRQRVLVVEQEATDQLQCQGHPRDSAHNQSPGHSLAAAPACTHHGAKYILCQGVLLLSH
jgi:hypothetical protein